MPATPAGAAASGSALVCAVQGPGTVAPGQAARFTMSLRNTGPQPLEVLVWATPFEGGWFGAWLELRRDGALLAYGGPSVKRGPPRPAEYLRLAPGEQRQADFDLAQVFDLRTPGRYEARTQLMLHDVKALAAPGATAPPAAPIALNALKGMTLACPGWEFRITR